MHVGTLGPEPYRNNVLCPPKIHKLNPNAQGGDGHYLGLGALGGD